MANILKMNGTYSKRGLEIINELKSRLDDNKETIKIHAHRTGYSKGYTINSDRRHEYRDMLKHLGVSYNEGNDAPRGGANGNYIEINTIELRNHIEGLE